MSRSRADGTPAQPVNKRKLNDRFVASQHKPPIATGWSGTVINPGSRS
jgi:hypothetical protein